MATTNANQQKMTRDRVAMIVLLGLIVIAAIIGLVSWNRTPQIGTDEEVFRTVDALFTAITARDAKLLAQSEERLKRHREAGKLPSDAANKLDAIIAKARAGDWGPAAERLYDFMNAQKREGAPGHPADAHKRKGAKSRGAGL